MDVKRKAMKIFSAEEQPMILRCSRRRFQTSNSRYEMQKATFYKSAFRAKNEPPDLASNGLSDEKTPRPRLFRATRLKCAMDEID